MSADEPAPSPPPHADPARFDQVIASVGPPALLVLIQRWMGERLRAVLTAEDLWQETLVHAWTCRDQHRWQDTKAYRAWLLGIARHRIHEAVARLDAKKRGGDEQTTHFSVLTDSHGARLSTLLPAGSTTPSQVAAHREAAELMHTALAGLPPESQDVLQLYLFEERPMEEVAAQLGLPVSTAWSRFKKGSAEYARRLAGLLSKSSAP